MESGFGKHNLDPRPPDGTTENGIVPDLTISLPEGVASAGRGVRQWRPLHQPGGRTLSRHIGAVCRLRGWTTFAKEGSQVVISASRGALPSPLTPAVAYRHHFCSTSFDTEPWCCNREHGEFALADRTWRSPGKHGA